MTVSDVALLRSKLLESYSRSSRPSKKIAAGEDEFDVARGAECWSQMMSHALESVLNKGGTVRGEKTEISACSIVRVSCSSKKKCNTRLTVAFEKKIFVWVVFTEVPGCPWCKNPTGDF